MLPGRVRLTGRDLRPADVVAIARGGDSVEVAPEARARIESAAAALARAVQAGTPIYGVTTGLGPRVVHELEAAADAGAVSLRILRGRATAVGEPLATEVVRAAMAVRLNGLCTGGAGAGIAVADGIAALLERGVHPVIPRTGSVGAADICLLAFLGLTLVGEGEAELGGERLASANALTLAGLQPVELGPKDGLAILSSSAVSVGAAALAAHDAVELLDAVQVSAALAMEGFRANLSPLDPRAVAARPAPGQAWAADGLRAVLAGGALAEPGAARRLQDPLSLRTVSQVHGALKSAVAWLGEALAPDLNGAADNPLVIADDERVISTGNFHVPALSLALDAAAIAVAQTASLASERFARLITGRLSGLADNLTERGASHSGFAAVEKTAQALTREIRALAAPRSLDPAVGAGGVEDDSTGAVTGALRLRDELERFRLLIALELMAAAQAVDLAGAVARLGAGTGVAYGEVRRRVAFLDDDRPIGPDIERVAEEALASGVLLQRVRDATPCWH
ncbi:MAG TPA: aromatic amino acid lyase [Solirubrobacteraceae bacterium]|jgi:histidine ammonia-lyase